MADSTTLSIDELLNSLGGGEPRSNASSIDGLLSSLGGNTTEIATPSINELLSSLGGQQTPASIVTPTGGIDDLLSQLGQEPTTPTGGIVTPKIEPPAGELLSIFGELSRTGKFISSSFLIGLKNLERANIQEAMLNVRGSDNEINRARLAELDEELKQLEPETDEDRGLFRRISDYILRTGSETIPLIGQATKGALELGAQSGVVVGGVASLALGPQAGAPIGLGAAAVGATFGSFDAVRKAETGFAIQELLDISSEEGVELPRNVVRNISNIVGNFNGALELLGLGVLARGIPGGKALLRKIQKETIRQVIKGQTFKALIKQVGVKVGGVSLFEAGIESTQEASVIFGRRYGENYLKELGEIVPETKIIDDLKRVAESGLAGATIGVLFGGIPAVARAVGEVSTAKDLAAGQSLEEAAPIFESNLAPDTISPLGEEITQLLGELGTREDVGEIAGSKQIEELLDLGLTDEEIAAQIEGETPGIAQETAPERDEIDPLQEFRERGRRLIESGELKPRDIDQTAKPIEKNFGKEAADAFIDEANKAFTELALRRRAEREAAETAPEAPISASERAVEAETAAERGEVPGIPIEAQIPPVREDIEIIESLGATQTEQEATPHLEELGRSVFNEGVTDEATFIQRMKVKLGNLWERFKGFVSQVYAKLREERGSIEFGGRRKTVKQQVSETTGQKQPEGVAIPERAALRRSLQRQVQVARKAQAEGKTEAFNVAKRKIAIIKNKFEGKVVQLKEAREKVTTEAKTIRQLKSDVVRKLRILPVEARSKFTNRILRAKTIEALGRIGNDISVEKAIQENKKEAKAQRRVNNKEVKKQKMEAKRQLVTKKALRNRIKKILKATKTKGKGGKARGRFTPEVEKVLKVFREAAKMEENAAADRVLELLNQYSDTIPPDEVRLEINILSSVHGFKRQSVKELTTLLKDIIALRDNGKMIADLRKFNRESRLIKDVGEMIDDITGEKGLPDSISSSERAAQTEIENTQGLTDRTKRWFKKQGLKILSWDNLLDALSSLSPSEMDESNINRIGDLSESIRAEKRGLRIYIAMFTDLYQKSFRISSSWKMLKKMRKDSERIDLGDFIDSKGRQINLSLSRAEARKRYMELQDPTLDDTFDSMGYTKKMKDAILRTLTPQDIAFAKAQMKLYQEYYETINEVYKRVYGIDLPFNPNYSPIKREGAQPDFANGFGEFLHEFNTRAVVGGRSLQARKRSRKPIAEQSDLSVFAQHVAEMEHFKAWAEKINDLNHIFSNPEVQAAIRLFHGSDIIGVVNNFLAKLTRNGADLSGRIAWMDKLRGNLSRAVLALKTVIGVKQLTSFIAFAEKIGPVSFTKNSILFWKNPIKNARFLWENSEFLQDRWNRQSLERDIRHGFASEEFSSFSANPSFLNMLMLNVRVGDIGAILIGGWAVYKHNIDQGKSVEEAIAAFEKEAASAQQSADLSELSQIQTSGSFAQLFTHFMSAPIQMVGKEIKVVRNLVHGRATVKQAATTLAIFHVLIPLMFQMVSDAFDADQDDEEFLGVPSSWWRAVVLGPMNSIPIMGDILEGIVRKAFGERVYDSEVPVLSIGDDIIKAIPLVVEPFDLETEEVVRAVRGLLSAIGKVKGVPLQTAFDITSSVFDMYDGEYTKALLKSLGYSPYVAEKRSED